MGYLLFIGYLLLFSWLITKSRFFKASGLSAPWLTGIFLAKVACGVFYGYLFKPFGDSADTWEIYNESLRLYHIILQNPSGIGDVISKQFNGPQSVWNVFGTHESFWNYLKDTLLVDIEVVFNFFSLGNYYINVVMYAYLSFGGYIAFYRGLLLLYPGSRISSLIAVFFIPSAFFWTSGMYKDGVLFMLFGYIIYQVAVWATADPVVQKRTLLTRLFKILVFIILLFALRNYIVLILLPCLLAWWLSFRKPSASSWYFTGILTFCVAAFFIIPYLIPAIDMPDALANRRAEFLMLEANTSLPAQNITPNLGGYFSVLPEAMNYGFLRPYLWENKGLRYLAFAVELYAFYGLIGWYIVKGRKYNYTPLQRLFFLFGISFLICNWLLLGYTAPIIGALVRYKSIFFSFATAHLLYGLIAGRNTLD